jgi:hypothetical protein
MREGIDVERAAFKLLKLMIVLEATDSKLEWCEL